MDRSELIRAAFRGLAEGLVAIANESPPKKGERRRAPRKHTTRQAPLPFGDYAPQMDDSHVPSVQELDALFDGNEGLAQLRRQMAMQKQAAEVNPAPPKPPDNVGVPWPTIPDL